jgi:SOS-response transcriptional repressor LexA
MAVELIEAAYRIKVGSPIRKAVLLALANHANKDGYCWPSQKLLAAETEFGLSTIRREIRALEKLGFIRMQRNYNQPSKYRLIFRPPQRGGSTATLERRPPRDSTPKRHTVEPNRQEPSQNPSIEPVVPPTYTPEVQENYRKLRESL